MPKNSSSGYGLIEILMALGILAVLGFFATLTSPIRARSTELASTSRCAQLANNIITAIKSHDNSSRVRNWLPQQATLSSAATNNDDPFCSTAGGRTAVCDTYPLFKFSTAPYLDTSNYQNFQNIRSAYVWAQSLYNTHKDAGICVGDGITLTPTDLKNLLPSAVDIPSWATEFRLFIKDANLACGVLSTWALSTLNVKVTVFENLNGKTRSCQASNNLLQIIDSDPPTLTLSSVTNAAGAVIPPGACTDRRTVPDILLAGGPGVDWRTIHLDYQASEPGAILACRRAGAFELDPPAAFHNCPDLPLGGTMVVTPGPNTVTYNTPLAARLSMTNMPDRGMDMHIYEVKAADTGGNESNVTSASFRVHTPTCIPANQYCPNATPVTPATSVFSGIGRRPYDDCLNGLCPVGTHSFCDPAVAANLCNTETFPDDCGQNICTGSITPSCVGVNPALALCNTPLTGTCGAACGTGTAMNCALAPNPNSVPCGTPVTDPCGNVCGVGTQACGGPVPPGPGCDCLSVNLATVPCGAYVPDSCGGPGTCGPGTSGCVPPPPGPPPPWSAGPWGPYQCSRHGSRKTCSTTFSGFPAGYTNYTFTFWAVGHRHDNDSAMMVTVSMVGTTFASYSSGNLTGASIGPVFGGHPWLALPGLPAGPGGQTLSVTSTGLPPTVYMTIWLDDGELQLYWNATAN